jgi:hypothetical protein
MKAALQMPLNGGTMMKLKNTETALMQFEDAAIRHKDATEIGNYKLANKSYNQINKSVAFLKENSEVGLLQKFLSHPSLGVRIWAATYLLPICETVAIEILEEIGNGHGVLSLDARTTLSEWRKGNLKV